MSTHRIYIQTLLQPGELEITGDEAQHAIRVKRLQRGDPVEVLDGQGGLGIAAIIGSARDRAGWRLTVDIRDVSRLAFPRPRLNIYTPMPKGPRLSDMIDGLSQVGAAMWAPLTTALSIGAAKPTRMDRIDRVAAEASKQCGRPWLLEIGPAASLRSLLAMPGDAPLVMADATGGPYIATGAAAINILIGPEGGWRDDELALAADRAIPRVRFGPYTMRIETAAIVAAAVVFDAEFRHS